MRVLMITRPDRDGKPGGDVVALERAAAALTELGVESSIAATTNPDPRGFDVAHVFGIFDPPTARKQIESIRRHGIPLVISPIWLDRSPLFIAGLELDRALRGRNPAKVQHAIERIARRERELLRRPGRGARRWLAEQSELLSAADVIVPEADIEAFACSTVLRVTRTPYFVAHYGTDETSYAQPPAPARSGIVCIGRIERLKNQAMLLFALRDVDVEITLVGQAFDPEYARLCRRWATRRTHFVERLPADDLHALVARSAVHVLPSWGDLPGFVSIEAALLGARVVAGTRGSEREYLGAVADYVDPLDADGIRATVVSALAKPPRTRGDELDRRLRTFTWRRYAEIACAAYTRASSARQV